MCPRPASYVQPSASTVVLLLVMLGCTRVSDNQRFPPTDDEIAIVETVPTAGAEDVPPDAQLDLCLSNLVDPRSITDTDATISSGAAVFDSRLSVQLLPWRVPGGSAVPTDLDAPWCEGSVLSVVPRSDFVEGVRFRLRLDPNAVGWAGESLDVDAPGWVEDEEGELAYVLEFVVGEAPNDPPPGDPTPDDPPPDDRPVAPTLAELFTADRIFDPERGTCSCHQTPGETAIALLDLSTPERAFDQLLLPSRLRDTGFPMVTPRRPSESFLLHKLLRDREGDALHGVLGSPMPPDEPLPYADYVDVARWIDGGANP